MKHSRGLIRFKFISMEFLDPMIRLPYVLVDHVKRFETSDAHADPGTGLFTWENEQVLDVEIPLDATEVHLYACNRVNGIRLGLCRLSIPELDISQPEVQLEWEVQSQPYTYPLEPIVMGNFNAGKITFAFDFFPRVRTTYRKFDLTAYFRALALKTDIISPEEDLFYLSLDGLPTGNNTMKGIGAHNNALEAAAGQGFTWYHWGSNADDKIDGLMLGEFKESYKKDCITIDVHRRADDTLVATGELQFALLREDSNDEIETHTVDLRGNNEIAGYLFLGVDIEVTKTGEEFSGYCGATSSDEDRQ